MVMTTRQAGRKAWENLNKEERKELTSKAGKAAWASMTPAERSAEMKRRAKKRKKAAAKKTRTK
jgi:hypothetical protein